MKLLPLAILAATSGCTSLPPYVAPAAGPDTAIIDTSRIPVNSICSHGTLYSVGKLADNKLVVPTTGRVAIYGFVYISDYNVSYSCMPGISFKPEKGQSYLMNLEIEEQKCRMEVYRKGGGNRIGLELEDSMAPAVYCR